MEVSDAGTKTVFAKRERARASEGAERESERGSGLIGVGGRGQGRREGLLSQMGEAPRAQTEAALILSSA